MDRSQFMVVYEQLKSELLADSDLFSYSSDARTWMEKVPPCLSIAKLLVLLSIKKSMCALRGYPVPVHINAAVFIQNR